MEPNPGLERRFVRKASYRILTNLKENIMLSISDFPATEPCIDDIVAVVDLIREMPPLVYENTPQGIASVYNQFEEVIRGVQNQFQFYMFAKFIVAMDNFCEQVFKIQAVKRMGIDVGFFIADADGNIVGGDDIESLEDVSHVQPLYGEGPHSAEDIIEKHFKNKGDSNLPDNIENFLANLLN
jgi:hypothetical protein